MAAPDWRVTSLLCLLLLCLGCLGQDGVRSPPDIETPDRANTRYINEMATHEEKCVATGVPQPTYKWMKNGKEIVSTTGGKVQVDATTGTLTIRDYVYHKNDGSYMCVATNSFPNEVGPDTMAAAFSPVIQLKQNRISLQFEDDKDVRGTEYSYLKIPCEYKGHLIGSDIVIMWYLGTDSQQITDYDKGRLYVDTEGTLHFTYLLKSDDSSGRVDTPYRCGIGSTKAREIKLGGGNRLEVSSVNNPSFQAPKLEFSNSGVKAKLFTQATLECFFSGYDPQATGTKSPEVKWESKNRNPITVGDKFEISADTRRLIINNVQEDDEGAYYCMAMNSRGEETQWYPVELDVISAPIWLPSGSPADMTVPEGDDAEFACSTRSMKEESPPGRPIWYVNGKMTGSHTDTNKILLSPDKQSLRVKSARKPQDILCVQCQVQNPVGTTWGDACLNVILPIKITQRPPDKQEIVRGDVIDLLVEAESDPIVKSLNQEYFFKNKTYGFPFEYLGNKFKINTSEINDDEYRGVQGVYKIEIASGFEKKVITTEVELVDPLPPVVAVTSSAGFPMWIIGLIAGILFLLIILLIIICVICRKKQEGDYNVDKKEVGAGLNPKQELMEKGFDDYSRPNPEDYEYGDKPRRELPYDEDDPMMGQDTKSLGEYSEDEEALFFNEDGSFIGQYHKKDPIRPNNETNIYT